jgi:hypothetical protein
MRVLAAVAAGCLAAAVAASASGREDPHDERGALGKDVYLTGWAQRSFIAGRLANTPRTWPAG